MMADLILIAIGAFVVAMAAGYWWMESRNSRGGEE